jgi:ribonuclease E
MKREMLINVLQPEECRIAILEDGLLEELYVERTGHESYVGNIYKGRIVNIEPSIQAAFIDFGVGRNGFLHVSDVEQAYYRHLLDERDRRGNGRGERGERGERRGGRQQGISRPGVVIPPAVSSSVPPAELEPLDDEAMEVIEIPDEVADQMLGNLEEMADDIGTITAYFDEDANAPGEEPFPEAEDEDFSGQSGEAAAEDWSARDMEADTVTVEELDPDESSAENSDTPEASAGLATTAEEDPAEAKGKRKTRSVRGKRGGKSPPARGKRGGRTSSRKKDAPEEFAEGEQTPALEAGEPETSEEAQVDPDQDRPRPMESAERRTREDDPEVEPIESFSGQPHQRDVAHETSDNPLQDISDEDLSFSLRRPAAVTSYSPPPVPASRQPEFEDDFDKPADTFEEPADTFEEPADTAPFEEDFDDDADVGRREMDEDDVEMIEEFDEGGEEGEFPSRRRDRGRDRSRDRDRGGRDRRGPNARRSGGGGFRTGGMMRPKPLIQDIFKKGQEVLVQVIKEGIGTKGPTLSTYISIAGRYLVLMPGLNRIGVSRKITDEEQRRRLRDILSELKPPKGLGFIIRTAGLDRTKKELQRDLAYLARLWQVVVRRIKKFKSPAEIYQESDMITRTIRDTFTNDIQTIWVDEPRAFEHAQEFLTIVMPRYANRIKFFKGSEPIFHKYGIENEITKIHQRHVPLPNGGSIVIDQTEALVAIDVNSGNFRADGNAEETAYQMNLIAAREIGRQLRLRDLGGVIVNDFIDMREERHRRNVERALRDAVRRDRARTKILRISQFGIIEMTRQRIRPSLKRSVYQECPHCNGSSQVKTCESMSIEVMRLLQLASTRDVITQIYVRVNDEVANYLHNRKRAAVAHLEEQSNTQINVSGRIGVSPEFMEFQCYDNNNNEIHFPQHEEPRPSRRRYPDRGRH